MPGAWCLAGHRLSPEGHIRRARLLLTVMLHSQRAVINYECFKFREKEEGKCLKTAV